MRSSDHFLRSGVGPALILRSRKNGVAKRRRLLTLAMTALLIVVSGLDSQRALAQTSDDLTGKWSLDARITVSYPSQFNCSFLSRMGDPVIPITFSEGRIGAFDTDTGGQEFILQGAMTGLHVNFAITGFGITPGGGGCSLASRNISTGYSGDYDEAMKTITGEVVSGYGEYAFQKDGNGNLIWTPVTWSGTFTARFLSSSSHVMSLSTDPCGPVNPSPDCGPNTPFQYTNVPLSVDISGTALSGYGMDPSGLPFRLSGTYSPWSDRGEPYLDFQLTGPGFGPPGWLGPEQDWHFPNASYPRSSYGGYLNGVTATGNVTWWRWVWCYCYGNPENWCAGFYRWESTFGATLQPRIDIAIGKHVKVAQAVYYEKEDAPIPLVANRDTAILIPIKATEDVPNNARTVIVRAGLELDGVETSEEVILDAQAETADGQKVTLVLTPTRAGDDTLWVDVHSQNKQFDDNESDMTNNEWSAGVSIAKMPDFVIPYVGVSPPCPSPVACYAALDAGAAGAHVFWSNKFMEAVFPVWNAGIIGNLVINEKGDMETVTGSQLKGEGVAWDTLKVALLGVKADADAKVVVGIVPDGYFVYHGYIKKPGTTQEGYALTWENRQVYASLVTAGWYYVTAHELGHAIFGLTDSDSISLMVDGYWLEENKEVGDVHELMYSADQNAVGNPVMPPPSQWVSRQNWESMYYHLRAHPDDPDRIFVSAVLHKDGTVELGPWADVGEGIPHLLPPGAYTMRLVDATGNTLLALPFDIDFSVHVDPIGDLPTETAPFALTMPYPAQTSTIRLEAPDGVPLFVVDPLGKALTDAIQAVPDRCFDKNPSQRRNALVNKVTALQQMLDAKDKRGALNKLTQDIKKQVQAWLVDSCQQVTALDVTKEELLDLIDKSIVRVQAR